MADRNGFAWPNQVGGLRPPHTIISTGCPTCCRVQILHEGEIGQARIEPRDGDELDHDCPICECANPSRFAFYDASGWYAEPFRLLKCWNCHFWWIPDEQCFECDMEQEALVRAFAGKRHRGEGR